MAADDPTHAEMAERVRDAVAEAVAGTRWAPAGGVLVDCVVFMGFFNADGTHGASHLICGSPWASVGLVEDQLDRMVQLRSMENAPPGCDCDD